MVLSECVYKQVEDGVDAATAALNAFQRQFPPDLVSLQHVQFTRGTIEHRCHPRAGLVEQQRMSSKSSILTMRLICSNLVSPETDFLATSCLKCVGAQLRYIIGEGPTSVYMCCMGTKELRDYAANANLILEVLWQDEAAMGKKVRRSVSMRLLYLSNFIAYCLSE